MLKLWKALIQTQKSLSEKKGHLQYRSLSKGWEPLEVRSLLSVTPYNYGEINIGNIEFDADVTAKFELETIENTSTSQEVPYRYFLEEETSIPIEGIYSTQE
ncbi:MAG: hypothetical protein IJD43_04265 [Thermoguttaceae bacterium]|nr:hypothetical protein [Thermoguttaceae bacterium]